MDASVDPAMNAAVGSVVDVGVNVGVGVAVDSIVGVGLDVSVGVGVDGRHGSGSPTRRFNGCASAGRILRAAIIHRTPFTREGALSGGLASKL
jgi:hypothetical protein